MAAVKRWILVLAVVLLAGGGFWFYENSSLARLRGRFIPWMERLGRWRDGIELTRRALKSREATSSDPAGIAGLRAWAWKGLERVAYISYEVEKPAHAVSGSNERTTGRVVFTVGGFDANGVRIERSSSALVTFQRAGAQAHTSVRWEGTVSERSEASPRFHDATKEAGLGAPRNDPPLHLTNRLIAGIW